MRPMLTKSAQSQLMLTALFVAALSFITLAASFAEMPAQTAALAVESHD